MRHLPTVPALLALLVLSVAPARAQVALEVRAGAAIGNHAPTAAGLETVPRPAYAAAVEIRALPLVSVYGGYSVASFGCREGLCTGADVTVTTRGFGGGVRVHPERLPWVRAGALYFGATSEANGRTDSVDPTLGYEVGAGFSVPLSSRTRVLPGVYLRSQPGENRTTLLGADVGVQLGF